MAAWSTTLNELRGPGREAVAAGLMVILAGACAGFAGCGSKSGAANDAGTGDGSIGVAGATGTGGGGGGGIGGGGGRGPVGSWPPTMTTNDAATLAGGMFGRCDGSAPRRKKIPLLITGGSADFGYGDAYLVEDPSNVLIAVLFGIVTNLGSTVHCNIAALPNGYDWYDTQGRSLNVTGSPTILGSEGNAGSLIYVQSCLAPGETGVILGGNVSDGPGSPFDVTASISLALTYSGDGVLPAGSVVPQRYTVNSGDFLVFIKNTGTEPDFLPTSGFPGTFVTFDDGGLPLWWGPLSEWSTGASGISAIAPGEEGFASPSQTVWGCATQLRIYIAFAGEIN
jgi:hypothetical protein